MNYGKRRLLFLTDEQERDGWVPSKHMPDMKLRRRFTVRQWQKFDTDKQMYLTKIFHVILTDHRTRKEKVTGLLKAVLRPTPAQKKSQKSAINKSIKKVTKGIDQFDKAMDDFSRGLNGAAGKGHRDDPVRLVFGDRRRDTSLLTGHRKCRSVF
jgi:hypothetical protein